MISKKSGEPSAESLARANRQRIAAEEGKRAMEDVERRHVAVRQNMARLRALREAEAASHPETASAPAARKPRASRKKAVK